MRVQMSTIRTGDGQGTAIDDSVTHEGATKEKILAEDIEKRCAALESIKKLACDSSYAGVLKSALCCRQFNQIEITILNVLEQQKKKLGAGFCLRTLATMTTPRP